jgi:hypothetical protein
MDQKTKGVRKGAWTYEEDKLLKDCINKYGEGKWHLVPQRAGIINLMLLILLSSIELAYFYIVFYYISC